MLSARVQGDRRSKRSWVIFSYLTANKTLEIFSITNKIPCIYRRVVLLQIFSCPPAVNIRFQLSNLNCQSFCVSMHSAFVPFATTFVRSISLQTPATCQRIVFSRASRTARMAADCGKQEPYSNRNMSTTGEDSTMATIEQKISAALSPTRLSVVPTYGDPKGSHVTITVVSDMFEGLNMVKRHKAVYKTIWEELQVR